MATIIEIEKALKDKFCSAKMIDLGYKFTMADTKNEIFNYEDETTLIIFDKPKRTYKTYQKCREVKLSDAVYTEGEKDE